MTPSDTPWLQVLGGKAFDLINPRAEDVDFETIATVLARIPRFAGHTEQGVYSVAQHCYEGARAILRDTGDRHAAAAFLLHDAHEAYMGDIATPIMWALIWHVEQLSAWGGFHVHKAIVELKGRLDEAIYLAAGLPLTKHYAYSIVKEYDIRMCRTERDARLGACGRAWGEPFDSAVPVAGVDLYPWSENTIRAMWLSLARELLPCFAVDSKRAA